MDFAADKLSLLNEISVVLISWGTGYYYLFEVQSASFSFLNCFTEERFVGDVVVPLLLFLGDWLPTNIWFSKFTPKSTIARRFCDVFFILTAETTCYR